MAVMGLSLHSCANIGSPEGGPMDFTPPVFVKSSPAQGAINVKGNKAEIVFDEIVNIKDQQKKVSVSPVQKEQPIIKSLGKKVTIEFRDEMKPNTTYCVDFSNAIEDNNEGNPLDGFAFAFSTGDDIDTLEVSGIMLRARDLEPMQHVIVGLHSCLDDTAFTKIPLERISRTNDRGQFTLRNLKPGRYHVFGLNDMDGDYRMARTEDIAFLDEIIVPTATQYESMDTVFTYDNKVDTVIQGTHTQFLPNNVLLMMFNEDFHSLYRKTTSRPSPSRLHVLLSTRSPQLPTMRLLKPEYEGDDWYVLERTPRNDSLFYWVKDSALIKSDSIVVAMDYLRTDSTDNLSLTTDTITFAYRKTGSQLKAEAQEKKDREERAKRAKSLREKLDKGKEIDPEDEKFLADYDKPNIPKLDVKFAKSGSFEIYDTLFVNFPTPIDSIDPGGVHLEMRRDSLWIEQTGVPALCPADSCSVLRYMLPMTFEPDSAYRITIDSLAIRSIYGIYNDPIKMDFNIKGYEQYANLVVKVNVPDHAFIEMLDTSDKVVRRSTVGGGRAEFENVLPSNYYLRLVLDANDNGEWDTGNYAQHLQPEEVYYYPKRLKLRRNWDVEETWDIYATALDLQKQPELLKNRPEESKNKIEQRRNKNKKKGQNDDEEEDEFNSNGFINNIYSGDRYRDYQQQNTRR